MFDNLSIRAIIPVALTITGFVLLCCILLYSAIKDDLTQDAVQHSVALANTVVKSTRYAMLRSDRETLRNIVDNVAEQSQVEHLRIFDKKGLIVFSHDAGESGGYVDKQAAGCLGCHGGETPLMSLAAMQQARRFVNASGTRVLAVTAPIYNEPACSNAACHTHPPQQQILGILDIGLDTAPMQQALTVLWLRMAAFTLLILLLTVGGVAALLHRTVLSPIQNLADFTHRPVDANLVEGFKKIGGEIGVIATNCHQLHRRLEHAQSELDARRSPQAAAVPSEEG